MRSPNPSTAIALFPGAWAKDAIAYSEHCDCPAYPEAKPGDRALWSKAPCAKIVARHQPTEHP
jgi:hypothetical protein